MRTRIWFVVFLLSAGCSDARGPCYPVSGTVDLNDQPLPAGRITLVPDASLGNTHQQRPLPEGDIQNGKFTIHTGDSSGAPAGAYRAVIVTRWPGMPSADEEQAAAIPAPYTAAGTTPLTLEVRADASAGDYRLHIK